VHIVWHGLAGNVQDHADYIGGWLSVLKNDKKAIFKAAAEAQKAHEWIKTATEQFYAKQAA
jgi:antirestriction protein ArdC